MDKIIELNFVLPMWYPLVVVGIFFLMRYLHSNNFELTGETQTDRTISALGFIMLFGSEVLYCLCKREGGSLFYYMDPDVVGWIVTIIAFIMTFIVVIGQFIWYLKFIDFLHDRPYSYISNLGVWFGFIVLVVMNMFGICEEFMDKHEMHILFAIMGIHIIIVIVQNILEGTIYMILLEIPLLFLGLGAFILSSIVAVILLVLSIFSRSSSSSSSDQYTPSESVEPDPPASCKECGRYDISRGYCYYFEEEKDPYLRNGGEQKATYDADGCPYFTRR